MKGKFGVVDLRRPRKSAPAANLIIPFHLDGPTEKVFEIQLNEDQMKLLPK